MWDCGTTCDTIAWLLCKFAGQTGWNEQVLEAIYVSEFNRNRFHAGQASLNSEGVGSIDINWNSPWWAQLKPTSWSRSLHVQQSFWVNDSHQPGKEAFFWTTAPPTSTPFSGRGTCQHPHGRWWTSSDVRPLQAVSLPPTSGQAL